MLLNFRFKILISRLLGQWAQNLAFIVLCRTNSIQSSAIYKLTGGNAGWLAQHCISIVMCPPNNASSFAIYKFTHGMQGWQGGDCHCLPMLIPMKYLTEYKTLFSNTKLLILNIDIVQLNYIKLLKNVKSLIFEKMKERNDFFF